MKSTTKTLITLCGSFVLAVTANAELAYTTGLDVWLDASDIDGSNNSTLVDGAAVATWKNKGTTGVNDAVAILTGGGTNGVFVVNGGTGEQDAVQLFNTRYQFGQEFMDSPNVTIYFVVNQGANSSAAGSLLTDYGTIGNELLTVRAGISVSGARDASGDNTWVNDGTKKAAEVWATLFFTFDATTQTATFGEPGNLSSTTNVNYDPATTWVGTFGGPVTLFGFHNGDNGHDFNGFVSEVLIFDHVLDSTARTQVEAYLAAKATIPDADADGISDGYELANTDPPSATALVPAEDDDSDGLSNLKEYLGQNANGTEHGFGRTLASVADSDSDGANDGNEVSGALNPYQIGHTPGNPPAGAPGLPTNPLDSDSDNDGILDGEEVLAGADTFITNPNDADTDGDLIKDGYEIANNLLGGLDPTDANDGYGGGDLDNDGLDNYTEFTGTPQTRADKGDTDGDGYSDLAEDNFGTWLDVDGTGTNPTKPDTDGDGLLDGQENPDLAANNPPSQYKSDPNLFDSDTDTYGDGAEATAGTDPSDINDFPPPPPGTVLRVDFHREGATGQEIQAGWSAWEVNKDALPASISHTFGAIGVTLTAGGTGGYVSSRGGPTDDRGGEFTGTSWNDVVEELLVARNGDSTMAVSFTGLDNSQTYTLTLFHNDPYTVAGNAGFATGNGVVTPTLTTGTIVGTAVAGTTTNVRPGARADGDFSNSTVTFNADAGGTATVLLTSTTNYVVVNGMNLTSAPRAEELVITHSGFNASGHYEVTVTGLNTAKSYVLKRSANLMDGFPDTASGPFTPSSATQTVADPAPPLGMAFYRIEELP